PDFIDRLGQPKLTSLHFQQFGKKPKETKCITLENFRAPGFCYVPFRWRPPVAP
ncbi:unnamed protein product, partial [Urochloa humidicola]